MATYTLHLIRNGKTEKITLSQNQALIIQANEQYQLFDENGNPIELITEQKGNEIWLYAQEKDVLPELIIRQPNSMAYMPNSSSGALAEPTMMTQMTPAKVATASTVDSGKVIGVTAGILAVGGLAAAAGGGGGGGGNSTPPNSNLTPNNTDNTQPLQTAKGTSVKADPLPVFDGEISIKGESVKADPLPVFDGEISIKGESVKADPLPVFDGEISIKGESVKADPLPVGKLPNLITITSVDDDNTITPDEIQTNTFQKYSLTGKLDLSNTIFTQFKYKEFIENITLQIGNKQYLAQYNQDDDSFVLTLSRDDWAKVEGQNIANFTLNINTEVVPDRISDTTNMIWSGTGKPIEEDYFIFSKKVSDIQTTFSSQFMTLNQNEILKEVNGIPTVSLPKLNSEQITISGKLIGENIDNQTIDITVHQQHYTVQINQQGLFNLTVSADELAKNPHHQITATWQHNGETITDTVSYIVAQNQPNAELFVSHHNKMDVKDMHYFLQPFHKGIYYLPDTYPSNIRKPLELTYHFKTEAEAKFDPIDTNSFGNVVFFTPENKEAIRNVLSIISKYTNIHFTEVESNINTNSKTHIDYYMGDILTQNDGYAYYAGDVYLNAQAFHFNSEKQENRTLKTFYGFSVILHETLHSLGLKHIHEGNYILNEGERDVGLSFMKSVWDSATWRQFTPISIKEDMRVLDMAYLHYLYGVNPNQRTDNDIYTFKAFNPYTIEKDIYIWDGAGLDTFDASQETQGVTVDLTPGSWIYSGEKSSTLMIAQNNSGIINASKWNQFFGVEDTATFAGTSIFEQSDITYTKGQAFIGYDTQLENLIGSNYDDTLTGNNAPNLIVGLNGNDTIDGGKGDDDLHGSAGNDTLIGGDGNDRLNGGIGNDVLTGGAGDDVFVFSSLLENNVDVIKDFGVGNDKIELSANIFHQLSDTMSDFAHYIQFDKTTGKLSYDVDGVGDGVATHFATLENYTGDLTQNQFVIA